MPLTPLPTPPDPNDRATFNPRAYPFTVALQTMGEEINDEVIPLCNDAIASSSAAIAAAAYKGPWASLSGALAIPATVSHGAALYMLLESVADVAAEVPGVSSKWRELKSAMPLVRSERTSNAVLTAADFGRLIDLRGSFTQTFAPCAALGNGWWCYLRNTGNGDVTLDPDGAELIDGHATCTLKPGFAYILQCDGMALRLATLKIRSYAHRTAPIAASTTWTVPPDTYIIRGYAVGAGGNGVGGTGGYSGGGGGMAYGDIAVTPGQAINISIAAGTAKVSVGAVDYLIGSPASGMTAGTASKHASVTNGGAYSGGTGVANGGSGAGGASSGSPLGKGVDGAAGSNFGGSGWGGKGATNAGGGCGGSSSGGIGGPGLPFGVPVTDPLLRGLHGPGASNSTSFAGPGGGGAGQGSGSASFGQGGFGGGGGGAASGGAGGFGGGGGGGSSGGFGGGGGGFYNSAGGGAAVILMWD